jgi:hypothetical protein
MTTAALSITATDAIRASDADRDKALGLLRDHWLAGRLTLDEYEERCDEAAGGRFLTDLERALRELPYPLPEHAPLVAAPAAGPTAAPAAPPGPDLEARAVLALTLGILSLAGVVLSLGMLFVLTLPASTWAWTLGRRSRRGTRGPVRVIAGVAEALGILATVIACLPLAACAAWVAA